MKLCKHEPHKVIDWIKSPKWSTDQVLINTQAVTDNIEHYLIQFTDDSPKRKYGWFYLSGNNIRRAKKQPNGRGEVYAVPMSLSEEFEPIKQCKHGD